MNFTEKGFRPRKVNVRLPGKGNSNFHSARPVHPIITMMKWIRTSRLMIKWIRTSRLSIKNSLSSALEPFQNSWYKCSNPDSTIRPSTCKNGVVPESSVERASFRVLLGLKCYEDSAHVGAIDLALKPLAWSNG